MIDTSYSDGGNTVFTSLGNGKYQLQLKLDGGTGDLFKYNDGTPFVGEQAALPLGYWDNDANAANNNVATGAGMGGTGNWDAASAKWYNGSTNSPMPRAAMSCSRGRPAPSRSLRRSRSRACSSRRVATRSPAPR